MPYDKEKTRKQKREYYLKNRERILRQKKEYYSKNKDTIRPKNRLCVVRHYWENRKTMLEKIRKYRHSKAGKEAHNKIKRRYYYTKPEFRLKQKARRLANKLISLEGRKCEKCGSTKKLNRHHYLGYNRPLEIKILCEGCHLREHGKMPMEMDLQ